MTEQEQIQYLANLYYTARTDEKFDVEEDYLLQEIAKEIGSGYLQTRKALDLAMEKGFKITLAVRWSEKIRALEDMLLVAMWDKKLHEMEKKVVLTQAKKAGIGKEQFELIRMEAKDRLKKMKEALNNR